MAFCKHLPESRNTKLECVIIRTMGYFRRLLSMFFSRAAVFWLLLCLLTNYAFPATALATLDRLDSPNNQFGIHLAIPAYEDLETAHDLVNSSGGDWGYVTVVIEENDRNKEKWQGAFNKMRELHLVPIVRLATSPQGGYWRQPAPGEAPGWADFLDSLNWVVKNRYVVLFNEPNHGAEWGQKVDPQSYGQVALAFAKILKEKNPDFFVMMAGLDTAAPSNPPQHEDEERFLRKMFSGSTHALGELFGYLDGWASHSYPNHGFIGSPTARGKNSIRNYEWELSLLKRLGIGKSLPVYITETGWPHREGKVLGATFYPAEKVAAHFRTYFESIVSDPQVIAITPFVLNYQGPPFDHFSWQKLDSKEFYPQFAAVQAIPKQKGEPAQEQKLVITNVIPTKLIRGSTYQIPIRIKNEGQAIWSAKDSYKMVLQKTPESFEYFFSDLPHLEPFEEKTIWLHLKTGDQLGKPDLSLGISKEGKVVTNPVPWNLEIVPQIDIKLEVKLLLKRKNEGENFKLLIYSPKEEVVFEAIDIKITNGKGEVAGINNLVIGEHYRLVILKSFYLPRQGFLTIAKGENEITFEPMLPLDFNLDGELSFGDIASLLKKPKLLKEWWIN